MIGAAIVLVALIGMVGFHFIEGWPWFDGLYMQLAVPLLDLRK